MEVYIIDIPKILGDKHVTYACCEMPQPEDFQEDLIVRIPNLEKLIKSSVCKDPSLMIFS